jgi:hypothetical protein
MSSIRAMLVWLRRIFSLMVLVVLIREVERATPPELVDQWLNGPVHLLQGELVMVEDDP